MVHRLLDHYLKGGKPAIADEIEDGCRHSTEREIRASEAERASVKFKQVQYLLDRKDEIFNGMISGVTEWGLYVEIADSKCEGLLRIRDLKDDFYELDEEQYCLIGHRSKKIYRLGDSLQVKLKSADLVKKQIDFILAEDAGMSFMRKEFPRQGGSSKGGFSGGGKQRGGKQQKSGSKKHRRR
jgi:exoribonuclease R